MTYDTSYDHCMTAEPTPTSEDTDLPTNAPDVASSPESPAGPARITRFESRGFFPADYATVENGKVYASGAFWSVLRFAQFPAVLAAMSLVAVIKVPFHANFSEHRFMITLLDQDEKPVGMRVEGLFRTAPKIEHKFGAPGLNPVAFPIHGLKIDRPGEYSFVLSVDDEPLDRYAFSAIQVASVAIPNLPNE